jgi:hypothetical protein
LLLIMLLGALPAAAHPHRIVCIAIDPGARAARPSRLAATVNVPELPAFSRGDRAEARAELTIDSTWNRERLTLVAFVQERRSRAILAAAVRLASLARP